MGFFFDIKSANIVGYLTTSNRRPPRITKSELGMFLGNFTKSAEPLFSEVLISSSPKWIEAVESAGAKAYQDLHETAGQWDAPIPEDEFIARLAVLQHLFSDYNLFGIAMGNWDESVRLRAFTNYAAISSGHSALFLVPLGWSDTVEVQLRDPFPAIAAALRRTQDWPGVVFWTKSSQSAFAPLEEAEDLYHELRPALDNAEHLDRILQNWHKRGQESEILHLSDLHFGNDQALEKEPYVSTQLAKISNTVGRVVITGDLFNNPERAQARAFYSFRTALERERKEQAIVIPGNHDIRWRGNGPPDLVEMAKVQWSTVFVDDKTRCVFFCFDSSRDADLARGRVTVDQRIQVATEFDKLSLARPEITKYLRVALIHHHPFTFETPKETLVSRMLEKIKITDELFLRMDDADSFLSWCANRGVSLILHGHKHVPRYRQEWITRSDGARHSITTVGCGSTLGAEGKPLSYNLIAWEPGSRKWNASYFVDPGDGSGFVEEYLSHCSA
jgi:predicted phosphodiesterase